MDERAGRRETRRLGLRSVGMLTVLDEAAQSGLVNFTDAVKRLRSTSFHLPESIVAELLVRRRKPT